MAEKTKIEWCDATVNIWQGCVKVAPGCKNCYAERDVGRWGFDVWGKLKPRLLCSGWEGKLRALDRKAKRLGRKLKVFINSESDFFEDHRGVVIDRNNRPTEWKVHELRARAFEVFAELDGLIILLVTKRPENVPGMWSRNSNAAAANLWGKRTGVAGGLNASVARPNVWIGASISDQETAEKVVPELQKCRGLSPVLFLSIEPLLDSIELTYLKHDRTGWIDALGGIRRTALSQNVCPGIDWIIVGGESGPDSRLCNVEWIRSIVKQCRTAGVPCFVKQLGAKVVEYRKRSAASVLFPMGVPENVEVTGFVESNRTLSFRHRKGGDPAEWPADLQHVREFPHYEVSA